MIKLFALEATSNLAVAINGGKRENFEEGDKVLVTRDEYLPLLRLGFIFLGEVDVSYSDVSKLVVSPEDIAKAKAKVLEAQMPKKTPVVEKDNKKKAKKDETVEETPETTVEATVTPE